MHPHDLALLGEGVGIARKVLANTAFAELDSSEWLPGPDVTDGAALEAFIQNNCVTVHHPVGTCHMGADEHSVTDPTLNVRGLEGLRVVDASVMPRIVGGNTAAPVIMIAEKASDLILNRPSPSPAKPSNQQKGE